MKTLMAPWRMEHVEGKADKISGCLFEPPGSAPFDRKRLMLLRSSKTVVLLNRFPYTNGHLLVAPIEHVASITSMNQESLCALMEMVSAATRILQEQLRPDGFNIGCNLGEVAGAGIADHLHFHIVPRWDGDHNFMTVLAEVRSVPEHLLTTFDKLLPRFQALLSPTTVEKPTND